MMDSFNNEQQRAGLKNEDTRSGRPGGSHGVFRHILPDKRLNGVFSWFFAEKSNKYGLKSVPLHQMQRFPINNYKRFSELPLEFFDTQKFNVYILDFNWKYLYVNPNVYHHINIENDLVGKNMWNFFPQLASDFAFQILKKNIESGKKYSFKTTSPLNSRRLSIMGYPLEDCYYFTSTLLPDKENLVDELRQELVKRAK